MVVIGLMTTIFKLPITPPIVNIPLFISIILRANSLSLFLILCVSYMFIGLASEYVLVSDDLIYDLWINQLSYDRITEMLDQGKKWTWLVYVSIPVFLLIKLFLVTVCLTIGAFAINQPISFQKLFRLALGAEVIFLLPPLIKLFWFSLYQTNYTFIDLHHFYPLSAMVFFTPQQIETYLIYPLQTLNLFEVTYWVLLAKGIQAITHKSLSGSFGFVASTYGAGLLLWIIIVVFLTVTLS